VSAVPVPAELIGLRRIDAPQAKARVLDFKRVAVDDAGSPSHVIGMRAVLVANISNATARQRVISFAARRETMSSFYSPVPQDQENRFSPLSRKANGRPRS